jgi:hypothetical protein
MPAQTELQPRSVDRINCFTAFYNWTDEGALVDLFDLQSMDGLRSISLRDSMVNGVWDFSLLSDFLQPDVISYIDRFHFQLHSEPDLVYWTPISSGLFSISSAVDLLRPRRSVQPDIFRNVWSL